MEPLLAAGALDQRVVIQQKTNVRGSLGGHDETWAPLATVWASVRDATGREVYNAQAMGAAIDKVVTIRYRSDVTNAMRLVLPPNSQVARIEFMLVARRKTYLVLTCRTADGGV